MKYPQKKYIFALLVLSSCFTAQGVERRGTRIQAENQQRARAEAALESGDVQEFKKKYNDVVLCILQDILSGEEDQKKAAYRLFKSQGDNNVNLSVNIIGQGMKFFHQYVEHNLEDSHPLYSVFKNFVSINADMEKDVLSALVEGLFPQEERGRLDGKKQEWENALIQDCQKAQLKKGCIWLEYPEGELSTEEFSKLEEIFKENFGIIFQNKEEFLNMILFYYYDFKSLQMARLLRHLYHVTKDDPTQTHILPFPEEEFYRHPETKGFFRESFQIVAANESLS